ncbi:hypothetical protein OG203_06895 [Nocardia sp. NBC_01499]|uniref:hypothetical protein n=1 Tax=Nocardia sp. NBC_01499 TaxID=2903597 RepID=UPI00386803DE
MGVLGLHNECPPVNYSAEEAPEVVRGLVIDEVATAQTLRAVGKAVEALACMDDAVREVVTAWGAVTETEGAITDLFAPVTEGTGIEGAIKRAFSALHGMGAMIDASVKNYRELEAYSAMALANGRGHGFEGSLKLIGEGGFAVMVRKRIELLRKLKTRVLLIQSLEPTCNSIVADNNFPAFFTIFMEPMRDLAVASRDVYSETIRGSLASYTAMLRSCELVGDDAVQEPTGNGAMPKPEGVRLGAESRP